VAVQNDDSLYDAILKNTSTKNVDVYDGLIDNIYYNNFLEFDKEFILRNNPFVKQYLKNNDIDLYINKNGFRSPEFKNDIDFLISGCSITMGDWLPSKFIWHEMLLRDTRYSYASVAFIGDSYFGQVQKIFAYIKKYNKPKNILMLLPDFSRFSIINNKKLFIKKNFYNENFNEDRYNKFNLLQYYNSSISVDEFQNEKQYFKRPLDPKDVIPEELSHMYSAQMLHILEAYCNDLGINLIYATWDKITEQLFMSIKNENNFKNFISSECFDFFRSENGFNNLYRCHKDHELKDNIFFKQALDKQHHGIHQHIHYKNVFAKKLNEKFGYDFEI